MKRKILQFRQTFANRLNRSCRQWSSARIVVIFGCVLLAVIIASSAVIHDAIFKKETIPVMQLPRITAQPLMPQQQLKDTIVTDSLYHRLQQFRSFMDSLPVPMRDSLLRERPGLMDSVRILETIYVNNK